MTAPLAPPEEAAQRIVDFLSLAERLKTELRHSWLSNGRQESVAEHTWLMSVAAIMLAPHLEHKVDIGRTLALITLHDIAEAITGDIPFFEESARRTAKAENEIRAMTTLAAMLPQQSADDLQSLWQEYEDGVTQEAKFARALDKLEVQLQHNLADISTWTPVEYGLVHSKMDAECAHDETLRAVLQVIRGQAEHKMATARLTLDR